MLSQGLIEFDRWAKANGLDDCLSFTLALNVVTRHMRTATSSDIDRIFHDAKLHILENQRRHGLNCDCETHAKRLDEVYQKN